MSQESFGSRWDKHETSRLFKVQHKYPRQGLIFVKKKNKKTKQKKAKKIDIEE